MAQLSRITQQNSLHKKPTNMELDDSLSLYKFELPNVSHSFSPPPPTNLGDIIDIDIIEKQYTDEFYKKHGNSKLQLNQSLCCSDDDREYIHKLATNLKSLEEFNTLSHNDIVIVLIFIFYSLHYSEQNEDWLTIKFLKQILFNKTLGMKLYIELTSHDIKNENGYNFSSELRQYLLFGKQSLGGKNKSRKHKKIKKSKNKKYKFIKTRRK